MHSRTKSLGWLLMLILSLQTEVFTARLNHSLNSRKDDLGLHEQKKHKFSGITFRLMGGFTIIWIHEQRIFYYQLKFKAYFSKLALIQQFIVNYGQTIV